MKYRTEVLMKISIIGDSLSTFYGYTLPEYAVFYDVNKAMENGLSGVQDTWWYQIIETIGGELLVNAAYSGSRVSGSSFPAANSYERINALQTDIKPDVILVHLGHNDYGYGVPIYNDENNIDSFFSAYNVMLQRLKEVYPKARIICSTIMQTYITFRPDWTLPEVNCNGISFNDYNETIRKVCLMNQIELADIEATKIRYETLDGAHGTERGHMEIAKAWKQALNL